MSDDPIIEAIQLYRESIRATEQLYLEASEQLSRAYVQHLNADASAADGRIQDLHHGVLMKTYAQLVPSESTSLEQRQLGRVLLSYLWDEPVMGSQLQDAIAWLIEASKPLRWDALLQPFLEVPALRDRYGELESVIMRMANLIARSDGQYDDREVSRLEALQDTLDRLGEQTPPRTLPAIEQIFPDPKDNEPVEPSSTDAAAGLGHGARDALRWLRAEAERLRATADDLDDNVEEDPLGSTSPRGSVTRTPLPRPAGRPVEKSTEKGAEEKEQDTRTPEERLADAKAKLNQLIGLDNIKHQIETLTNFLKMEKLRAAEGLPTTQPSLHMAFVGNPGTGKTTVARIVAEIYGALGILKEGHLIETDRSGLVAEYAGQTGPKTNAKIDEAIDGVLFIDEAYTLIDESGQDQYGREAVQTLLKRMEDQRDQLVVILAGYPVEMETMIRSNPGLSSRVGTTLEFHDYAPGDLARIFGLMAGKAAYELPTHSRRRILYGFNYLYDRRDRHFGNGRTVRNSFERSVRRLANRLAKLSEVDRATLTTLLPEDIEIAGIEPSHLSAMSDDSGHVRVVCDHCQKDVTLADSLLGTSTNCPACNKEIRVEWGDPVVLSVTEDSPQDFPPEAPAESSEASPES